MKLSRFAVFLVIFLPFIFQNQAVAESVPGQIGVQVKSQGAKKLLINSLQDSLGEENVLDFEPLKNESTI